MSYEENLPNIITRLKDAKSKDPSISLQKISDSTGVSLATVTRIFRENSELQNFRYDSVRPIANMLLGLDDLDSGNDNEKVLKTIIKAKDDTISELTDEIEVIQRNYEIKIRILEEAHSAEIDHLKSQIDKKDEIISRLLTKIDKQDELIEFLNKEYINIINQNKIMEHLNQRT